MSQTLNEYLNEPYSLSDDISLLDETTTISDFLKKLQSMKGQASFANYFATRPITSKPHGYITLPSIFDPKNCYDEEGHPKYFVDDLHKFLEKYGDWEVTNESGDNTYNYNSPVEDYINMLQVTIANPNSVAFESLDLVFMKVGLALDPRGGYSDNVIAVFDNDYEDHYNATAFGLIRYDLASGSFTYNHQQYEYNFEGTIADEGLYLTISPSDGDLPDALDDEFDVYVDLAEADDVKETLLNTMNESFNQQEKAISNFKIEYDSEQID